MRAIPKKMILTAGPSRSPDDLVYVTDAVRHGWNFHHSDYIYKFEEAFAKYLGCNHALSVSAGTHALHLALVLSGIGKGDEVLIPDLTYVACSNVVHYTGAKPVFVEVDRRTWSIDVSKVEKYITKNTRVIMPVHLYGNVADMEGIARIAKKHNLIIIEDACEGLGCKLNNKMIGTLSDAAAFSFQGAKLLAIGEGGMLVTNRADWDTRARSLADHGIDFNRQFWVKEIGYMYPMSNIQAALGLARLEDIENLISRKRKIFSWYKEGLKHTAGIELNPERAELYSSYWMSSIILSPDLPISRDELRKKLRASNIDTRPFFFPISMFQLYDQKKVSNPVAYELASRGVNLPSGVMLEKSAVGYICQVIHRLLKT